MATNMETEGLHGLNNGVEVFEKVDEEEEEDVLKEEQEGEDTLPELPPTLLELSQSNSEKEETAVVPNNQDEEEDEDEDEDEDDDEDVAAPPAEGSYDPSEFDDLTVDPETKELFSYIMK